MYKYQYFNDIIIKMENYEQQIEHFSVGIDL
jgi:hypothetical protein